MGNPLLNVEAVNVDTGGGGDWLMYVATSANVTVNFNGALSATGLASILGVSHVQGGSGNDAVTGDDAFNKLMGGDGDDVLSGRAANDVLTGGNGDDTLSGDVGTDTISAGAGDDTILWAWGDGTDSIDGGADTDSATFAGNASSNLIKATWNGSVLTNVLNNALSSVEAVHADGGGGADWLIYAGTTADVTVNLATASASGFASIANFMHVQGGDGDDSLTGDGGVNKIIGGDGEDTIRGGGEDDTLTGGQGEDVFVYAFGDDDDRILDFDADVAGGQDLLDVTSFGITAADFGARVSIIDAGANTIVVIDGSVSILLNGVTGDGDNVITDTDFLLAP